jgi:pimeloyl-ACP methyl ester carboxylesterase
MPRPRPDVEYARHDGVAIAFQAFGAGPDLLVIPGWASHLERNWEIPGIAELLERLATSARVIVVDRRGSGLSDRFGAEPPTLEEHAADLVAVIRQAAAPRVSILTLDDSSMLGCVMAASRPELVRYTLLELRTVMPAAAKRPDVITTFVAGSGLAFEALGARELKGVPGRWPLFRVVP